MIHWNWTTTKLTAAAGFAAVVSFFSPCVQCVHAQSLSVLPVNVFIQPGQRAATLSVTNSGDKPTSIQIRAYDWSQSNSEDQLSPSNLVVVSPPLVTIPAASSQVVRLILRQPATGRESTYRIVLDQIPGPSQPGVIQMVLRLSIPIFVAPETKAAPKIQFHLEPENGKFYLVGVNSGLSHEAIRDIAITTTGGTKFSPAPNQSPYLLAGATKRWQIDIQNDVPKQGEPLRLTAHGIAGAIDEQVFVSAAP